MNHLFAVAAVTFKEAVRNKILYTIVIIALGIIVFSMSLGDWSVFARVQVMEDFGLATMSLCGLFLSIFIGVGLLGRELAQKTIYGIVTRSVGRFTFITGKFIGLFAVLLLNFLCMALIFAGAIIWLGGTPKPELAGAILLIWAEMAVLISAAMFFSTFTTPLPAALFTTAFYAGGHLNDLVDVETIRSAYPWLETLLRQLYFLLPNLEHFNLRSAVVYGLDVPTSFVALGLAYGALYATALLVAAGVIFNRKDL